MTTHPDLHPVGTRVRVIVGWWQVHDLPTEATITGHLGDPIFTYAVSVGDGREWAMAARELAPCG